MKLFKILFVLIVPGALVAWAAYTAWTRRSNLTA